MNNNSEKSFDRNQYMPPAQPQEAAPQPVTPAPQSAPATPPPVSVESAPPGFEGKKKIPMPVIVGLIVLIIIIGVVYTLVRRGQDSASATEGQNGAPSTQPEKVIPTLDATKPALSFTSVDNMASYKVGDEITVRIKANSQGADVNGYDLLFPYDKSMFDILSTKSAIDTFQIFAHDREDYYAVTGLKLLSVTDPTPFTDTEILEMKIKPKKAGVIYLEVLPERGKETSKFVDKDIKIIQPQIQPIKLEIK